MLRYQVSLYHNKTNLSLNPSFRMTVSFPTILVKLATCVKQGKVAPFSTVSRFLTLHYNLARKKLPVVQFWSKTTHITALHTIVFTLFHLDCTCYLALRSNIIFKTHFPAAITPCKALGFLKNPSPKPRVCILSTSILRYIGRY